MSADPYTLKSGRVSLVADIAVSETVEFGCAVSQELAAQLTILDEESISRIVRSEWELYPQDPDLTKAQRDRLDEQGIIREGLTIDSTDVLFSLRTHAQSTSQPAHRATKEDELKEFVTTSVAPEPHWIGAVVVQSSCRPTAASKSQKAFAEVEVRLQIERPIQVGDSITFQDEQVLVSRIEDDNLGADLLLSLSAADQLQICNPQKQRICRTQVLGLSRGSIRFGIRSLISAMPLQCNAIEPALFTAGDADWLYKNGFPALLSEFSSLRGSLQSPLTEMIESDAQSTGFRYVDSSIEDASESLAIQFAHLRACGIHTETRKEKGLIEIRLSPRSDQGILSSSKGEIRRPDTINYRTYAFENDGLFCEQIFGREDDFSRRRYEGHLALRTPYVSWFYRQGNPSPLSQFLGQTDAMISSILEGYYFAFHRDGEFQAIEFGSEEELQAEGWESLGCGGEAIEKMLTLTRKPGGPAFFRENPSLFLIRNLPVLPPDLRPIVLLENGNFATSDLNDLYRQVINRNNRLAKLIDLNAPEVIIRNEKKALSEQIDALFANSLTKSTVLGSENRPLKSLLDLISSQYSPSRVNWLGRDRLFVDSSVSRDKVAVPQDIFERLCLHEDLPVLLSSDSTNIGYIAKLPVAHPGPMLRVDSSVLQELGLRVGQVADGFVHRVLTKEGVDEARAMINQCIPISEPPSSFSGPVVATGTNFFDTNSAEDSQQAILNSIVSGDFVALDSPRMLMIGSNAGLGF